MLVEGICGALYEGLRPGVIHSHDMDMLCGLAEMLTTEMAHDLVAQRAPDALAPLHTILLRLAQDAVPFPKII